MPKPGEQADDAVADDSWYDPLEIDEAELQAAQAAAPDQPGATAAGATPDDQAATDFAGQPTPDDVSGQTPPETAQPPPEQPQQPQQQGDAQQPPGDLDDIDWQAMSPDQRRELATKLVAQDPDVLVRGFLRFRDYHEKNRQRADRERATEQERRDLEQLRAEIEQVREEMRGAGPSGQQAAGAGQAPAGMDMTRFAQWFQQTQGREATNVDWEEYRFQTFETRMADMLDQRLKPLETGTQDARLEAMVERFTAQFDQLLRDYPQARGPNVREIIAGHLDEAGSTVPSTVTLPDGSQVSAVEQAFLSLFGKGLLAGQQGARQQQAQQAASEGGLPPSSAGGEQEGESLETQQAGSDLRAVAEGQKRDPGLLARITGSFRSP